MSNKTFAHAEFVKSFAGVIKLYTFYFTRTYGEKRVAAAKLNFQLRFVVVLNSVLALF